MLAEIAIAGVVASAAYVARTLTAGGLVAATFIGSAALLGGAQWVALLAFFFMTSSALSKWRGAERDKLLDSLVEKGSRRDARQVIANGGVFAISALVAVQNQVAWQAIGIGAIAAATADTWSTEVGTVLGGTPRNILTWREVAPGTSGGITIAGSAAAIVASILAAVVAIAVDWRTAPVAIIAGGMAGSAVDSVLGATVQERRWCPQCDALTERRRHSCGTRTAYRGGIQGCDNDVVNLLSTIAGAVVSWTLTSLFGYG